MDQYVGRYKIVGNLGKGAMGVVFLAEDPLLNRQVALKTIDFSVEAPDQRGFLRERLLRDARAAAALSHPHVVGVFDVFEHGDTAWLVMEYVAGETLAQRMAATPPLDTGDALRILGEVASALDYTHARGVIHRDIKPSNIMIDAHGAAKIMDFGIARLSEARTTTPTGMVMGTVEYMAPEQVKGEPTDGRADQFALAAVAYQVLTGSTLFGPQSLTTLTYKLVNETPPLARVRNPRLPSGVDAVLTRALRKQPAERFVNCASFIAALAAAFGGTVPLAAPTELTSVEAPSGKKGLWLGIAAASVLAAGLAVGGVLLLHRQNPAGTPVAAVVPPAVPQPAAAQPPVANPSPAPAPVVPPANTKPATKPAPTPAEALPSSEPPLPPIEPPPPPIEPKPAPEAADASLSQASTLIKNRDFGGAAAVLTKVIAAHPSSAQAYELRGLANQEQKLFENAIQDYSADLRINPTHAFALHQRGVCYVQLKRDNLALADFTKALQLHPDFTSTYIARGYLYNRRADFAKAIEDFSQAIVLEPNNPNAYRGRMIAHRQSGDRPGAKKDEKKFNELKQR